MLRNVITKSILLIRLSKLKMVRVFLFSTPFPFQKSLCQFLCKILSIFLVFIQNFVLFSGVKLKPNKNKDPDKEIETISSDVTSDESAEDSSDDNRNCY